MLYCANTLEQLELVMLDDRSYWKNQKTDRLFKAVLSLKTINEAECFFRDLLTVKEIQAFSDRFGVADMLNKAISYREISKKTKVSTTTITRINQWLKRGMNGYKLALKRLNSSNNNHHHHKAESITL